MAKKILKYRLPREGEIVAIDAYVVKWLEIHEQNRCPHIWAIVDEAYNQTWEIVAWGTGQDIPEELIEWQYLGTGTDGAGYVWHYFGKVIVPDCNNGMKPFFDS